MSDPFAMRSVEEALEHAQNVFELKQRIAILTANVTAAEEFRLQAQKILAAKDERITEQAAHISGARRTIAELLEDNSKLRKTRDTLGEITERWWFKVFASPRLKSWITNALR